jgi:hypothetical protein
VLRVIQPYFVWRALVVASPVWYPTLPGAVRGRIFRVVDDVVRRETFDVDDVRWLFDA